MTQPKEIQYRPYTEGDEEKIVDLLKAAFKDWPRRDTGCESVDFWRWKYGYFPDRRFVYVAEVDGEFVGVMHCLPRNAKLFGMKVQMTHGCDVVTHPEYWNNGIWSRMLFELDIIRKEAGVDYLTNFTGNPKVVGKLRRNESYHSFPITLMNLVYINDVEKHFEKFPADNEWLIKPGLKAAFLINTVQSGSRNQKEHKDIQVEEINGFKANHDEFYAKASSHYDFIVDRSSDYLNWRYCDNRAGSYKILQASEGEETLGYIVLGVNSYNPEYPIGYIMDLLTIRDRRDAAELLIAEAVRWFNEEEVNLVNYLLPQNHPYIHSAKKNGFINSHIKPFLFYHPYKETDRFKDLNMSTSCSTYFTWGDHDSLPVATPRKLKFQI